MLLLSADRGQMMGVSLVPATESVRPSLGTRHHRHDAGTRLRVMYTKTEDNKLIANGFVTNRLENEKHHVSFPQVTSGHLF
jgi:hypothetical protein